MKRRGDQIAARVSLKERRLMERAAKKQDRSLSEWIRLTLVIEAEIQLGMSTATHLESLEEPVA